MSKLTVQFLKEHTGRDGRRHRVGDIFDIDKGEVADLIKQGIVKEKVAEHIKESGGTPATPPTPPVPTPPVAKPPVDLPPQGQYPPAKPPVPPVKAPVPPEETDEETDEPPEATPYKK